MPTFLFYRKMLNMTMIYSDILKQYEILTKLLAFGSDRKKSVESWRNRKKKREKERNRERWYAWMRERKKARQGAENERQR